MRRRRPSDAWRGTATAESLAYLLGGSAQRGRIQGDRTARRRTRTCGCRCSIEECRAQMLIARDPALRLVIKAAPILHNRGCGGRTITFRFSNKDQEEGFSHEARRRRQWLIDLWGRLRDRSKRPRQLIAEENQRAGSSDCGSRRSLFRSRAPICRSTSNGRSRRGGQRQDFQASLEHGDI